MDFLQRFRLDGCQQVSPDLAHLGVDPVRRLQQVDPILTESSRFAQSVPFEQGLEKREPEEEGNPVGLQVRHSLNGAPEELLGFTCVAQRIQELRLQVLCLEERQFVPYFIVEGLGSLITLQSFRESTEIYHTLSDDAPCQHLQAEAI